jgi:D-alanine-D-alanine ligase
MVDMGYSEDDLQKMGFAQNLIIKVKERVRKAEFKRKPPIMPALPPYVFNTPFSLKKRRRLLRVGIVYNKAHINTTEQKVYKKRPWLIGKTLKTIKDTIRERGYEVIPFDANEHLFENLKYTPVDIVFNIAAGGRGESRQTFLPSLFDFYSIPFTGTGVYGNVLGLDKSITKHLLMSNGIPTPPFQVFRKHTEKLSNHLSFPLIVKPIAEGSSHGIDRESVVNTKQKLQVIVKRILDNFHQPAIVEQYIDGRELTIGIVGNKKPEFLAILEAAAPPAKLKGKKLLTDDLKVKEGYFSDRTRVAKLSREKVKEVRELALKAYRVIRCNDYARIDIILDKRDKLWIIEVNTMPGLFMDYSGYVVCALKAGISYPQLINKILDSAFERYPALQKFK